jgi:HlyD family secretion protein
MVRQYIEHKQLAEDVLEKERAEATARLRQVEHDIELGTITSPVDGVVLARHISDERYLTAGTVLLEIGRLEDLEVEADILTLDVVEAEVGDPVEIYGPAIGPAPARGKVARIYPAGFTKISSLGVEQQRVKVIVEFEPEELTRLRKQRDLGVGYRVRVRIITAQKPDALVVPRSALFRGDDGQWQVFAVRGGEAEIVPIGDGLMNDKLAEAVSGLEEGELVVEAPESNLTEGAAVEPVENRERK